MNNTVEFVDSWGCKHTLTLGGAAEELKAFYDAWPGGLEEIESAVRAERQAQVIDAFGKGANQGWNEAVEAVGLKFNAVGNDGMNSYLHRDWAFHFAASARSLKRPLQAQEPTLMCQTCGADRAKEACKGDLLKCGMMGAAQSASPAAQSGAVEDLVQCEDCSGYGLIGEFTSHDYNERVCDTCACTGKVPRAQTAPAVSLSSVDLASDERALLQKAAQVISWHSFGECRAFGDGPIPEPSEVVGQIKEVLSRTAPQPVAEQVRKAEAASDWISLKNSIPNGNEQVITLTEKGTVGIHHASTVRDLVREELRGIDKCYLTHWQPLPAHPQAAQAKESGDE